VRSYESEVSDSSSESNMREMDSSSKREDVNDNLVEITPYFLSQCMTKMTSLKKYCNI
jgi:hypothetical protein